MAYYGFYKKKLQEIIAEFQQITPKAFEIHTKESLIWFKNIISKYLPGKHINYETYKDLPPEKNYYNGKTTVSKIVSGACYIFEYNPTNAYNREKLPYYDLYPTIFVLSHNSYSMLAINLHYLSPMYRAIIMSAIYNTTNNKNQQRLLNFSYAKTIKNIAMAKQCVRRYLYSNISNIYRVDTTNWDFITMLPTQYFVGTYEKKVWAPKYTKTNYKF